ncbi:MAG TPA: methyltransferase domain-containing protein [Dehalococcoidia bacterium]|jgi:ubiquinone/menaquinone biosynthesis C-methylase UbiE
MTTTPTVPVAPDLAQQSAKLLGHYAGYLGTWTIDLGLCSGALRTLAASPHPLDATALAETTGLDTQYALVWARSAYAAGVLDLVDGGYLLAPHMATLLLDSDAPGYLGGIARTFTALRETFLDLRTFLSTGQRQWWSDFDPEWIAAVGDSGQAFYRRMLNLVVPKLPAVQERLAAGCHVLDLACGTCNGPLKFARAFPRTSFTAVDGDAYTLSRAGENLDGMGLGGRFTLLHSALEELALRDLADVAIINISLHEARDVERVVANARRALREGGVFLVSEFPFPETLEACRALPAQIMCGIQFFEAHIGRQLLPANRFVQLLEKAGFRDVAAIDVTPVHTVIHGTK